LQVTPAFVVHDPRLPINISVVLVGDTSEGAGSEIFASVEMSLDGENWRPTQSEASQCTVGLTFFPLNAEASVLHRVALANSGMEGDMVGVVTITARNALMAAEGQPARGGCG